jgi:hypothetical protein
MPKAIIYSSQSNFFDPDQVIRSLNARPPLPPPWTVEEQSACFVVRDHNGQALAYVYFEDEPGRQCVRCSRASLRPLKSRCDEPPHEKDYYRANDCADEPSAFASLIPPDRLPKVRCYKSSNNPEHGRPDEPGGFILISRINQFSDYPRHKPNYDGPKNTHCILPPVVRFVISIKIARFVFLAFN